MCNFCALQEIKCTNNFETCLLADKGFEGEVHVNGYVRDTKLFNMQSCYVMQEDCLLQYLTVREALTISIELRMPGLGREKAALLVSAPKHDILSSHTPTVCCLND
ncbi:hypothetical protein V5799_021155 [Amblyomma americanum]|uniref:Uncharacterized protein n=1 Tax=Amblyomma americanum TaxID=6943 RepID=A0AAQ4FR58_AMBAM